MSTTRRTRARGLVLVPAVALLLPTALAACGDDDDADDGTEEATPAATSGDNGGGEDPAVVEVDIVSVAEGFAPPTVTVDAGTEVVWTNVDAVSHTTTANDEAWDSGSLGPDESFSFVASEAGTFAYFCAIHPSMVGELIVE